MTERKFAWKARELECKHTSDKIWLEDENVRQYLKNTHFYTKGAMHQITSSQDQMET
jgi:hypothetical protein